MDYKMTEEDKKEFEEWLDNKHKKKSEIDELLNDLTIDIHDELEGQWLKHCRRFNFDCDNDYAPYGDTYVCTESYITDESDHECREAFEKDFTADELIECLKVNPSFKNTLKELIEKWAYTKELEF